MVFANVKKIHLVNVMFALTSRSTV